MEVKEDLLCSLEKRLTKHDNNRKEIQDRLQEIRSEIIKEADTLEEKINAELRNSFGPKEERILSLIERLNNKEKGGGDGEKELLIKQAQEEELVNELKYEIQYTEKTDNFVDSYVLEIIETKTDINTKNGDEDIIIGDVTNKLQKHLNKIHESMVTIQNEISEICTKRRKEGDEIEKRINEKLETYFTYEDARIQEAVNMIKGKNSYDDKGEFITKAKLTLLKKQKYSLNNENNNNCDLIVTKNLL